jgi:hypothetical protein
MLLREKRRFQTRMLIDKSVNVCISKYWTIANKHHLTKFLTFELMRIRWQEKRKKKEIRQAITMSKQTLKDDNCWVRLTNICKKWEREGCLHNYTCE